MPLVHLRSKCPVTKFLQQKPWVIAIFAMSEFVLWIFQGHGGPHQLLDGTILELIKTLRPEEMANISQMRSSISMANYDAISQKNTAVAKEGDRTDFELQANMWAIDNVSHYSDVIMSTMASQITRGIHQWLVDSPLKGPVTWKILSFDYIIVCS